VRVVSTGDSGTDLEAIASSNSIFDVSRFGIHIVASPRFADVLLVAGPVGRAMKEPLKRCYEAMAEPKLVIAVGASAISGGVFAGGYAEANGVASVLPVDCFIPGDPPHPWAIIYGLLLVMGRV
jgi:Ni,Fe-hydrogenase III small subunit